VVAVDSCDEAVAYALLEQGGRLDHLYRNPDHSRRGLAEQLLAAAQGRADKWGCSRLYTEASELARPAFERVGYCILHRFDFLINHDGGYVRIHNFAMEKSTD